MARRRPRRPLAEGPALRVLFLSGDDEGLFVCPRLESDRDRPGRDRGPRRPRPRAQITTVRGRVRARATRALPGVRALPRREPRRQDARRLGRDGRRLPARPVRAREGPAASRRLGRERALHRRLGTLGRQPLLGPVPLRAASPSGGGRAARELLGRDGRGAGRDARVLRNDGVGACGAAAAARDARHAPVDSVQFLPRVRPGHPQRVARERLCPCV